MSGESREGSGKARVLVVDDDHRNVRLMESILKAEGYDILKAFDGQEALDLIEGQIPDLVLLDVMMPRMNGIELCRRLRARHATRLLPIIMVTALNAQEDKVHALETGADDFLSKPINRMVLLAKVRSILRVKSLQDEVERQKEQLEQANEELLRMQRFKESMTQMVVHDMKNSLTGIMGNVQLIQMQTDPPVTGRLGELVQRSQESCDQLMRMVLNILHIGRLEEHKMPLRPTPLALDEIARDNMNELMSLSAREGIVLESRIPTDLPQPKADVELVGRVIGNLLSNALKHTPRGGRITLDARPGPDEVILTVDDTGDGIPEDLLPHIFDKFRAGASVDGRSSAYDSGLGLTFCQLAVESHGGRIWIESRTGEGTRVFVALPMEPSGAAALAGSADEGRGAGRPAA